MERGVVGNEALEEFRERLLRWGELCSQLRELYYKYLDLAAFRSDKCYFPGRRCRRSWERQYDVGDLTLMWTYIANTAPLCGKLIRALAEVEYEMRLRALESLEKYGGIERVTSPNGNSPIMNVFLKKPVHAYLILLDDKLHVIWGEFNNLSRDGKKRAVEVERKALSIIRRYKRGEKVEMEVEDYEVDREYERLWLEVPLPDSVSKLLNGRSKAPVALFRNLGWLLSDDNRSEPEHGAGNPGQIAVRIFDWIAVATYAKRISPGFTFVIKLSVYNISRTKDGNNPVIEARGIGAVAKTIRDIYRQFGITLSEKVEEVIARGFTVLNALREEAFRREGLTYVVNDVGAWITFSTAVATLVLGDGYVMPFELGVAVKSPPEAMPKKEAVKMKELAKALGGVAARQDIRLRGWQMRLLLPSPPTPAFEKAAKLYDAFTNYPVAATVEIGGIVYWLTHNNSGRFVTEKRRAVAGLYEAVKRLSLTVGAGKGTFALTYAQLRELAKYVPVRLLNEMEKEVVREVRPAPSFDLEALKKVLEEVAKMAKITAIRIGKYDRVVITPYIKSKAWKIMALLKAAGIRASVDRSRGRIIISERISVEAILRVMSNVFPPSSLLLFSRFYARVTPVYFHPIYISYVKAVPTPFSAENPLTYTAATQRFTKLSLPPKPT